MIEKKTVYQLTCDTCGFQSVWIPASNRDQLKELASKLSWDLNGDVTYCSQHIPLDNLPVVEAGGFTLYLRKAREGTSTINVYQREGTRLTRVGGIFPLKGGRWAIYVDHGANPQNKVFESSKEAVENLVWQKLSRGGGYSVPFTGFPKSTTKHQHRHLRSV